MKMTIGVRRRALGPLLAMAGALLAAACTESLAPDPLLLTAVSGDAQEARVGTTVPAPLVVRVSGLDSLPRAGVPVTWTVVDGDGAVESLAATTDGEGVAEARWTLGPHPGEQHVAAVSGSATVTFLARATPPPPADWASVIEFRPAATLEGDALQTRVWLHSRWPGTLRLKTGTGCFLRSPYPVLLDAFGATVALSSYGCTFWVRTWTLRPADSLYTGHTMNVAGVPDGAYTLRFRFDVFEVNDAAGRLPDVELPVDIRR